MFSRIFIERPRFAMVISIVLTLAGAIAVFSLPITLYPEITPPTIRVSATYPGASAEVIANTVGIPLEEAINGVEDMLYMDSSSDATGSYGLTITFKVGTDPDMAQVKVQNRVSQALSKLPAEVQQQGVTVSRRSSDQLGFLTARSPNGTHDTLFLSNYVQNNIKKNLIRVDGVGEVNVYAPPLSMRVWLDANKITALNLPVSAIQAAIESQNIQPSLGKVGSMPGDGSQQMVYALLSSGRINDVEEFKQIIARTDEEGGLVRLGDVARIEIGQEDYNAESQFDGAPSVAIAVNMLSGANAINAMSNLRAEMARLEQFYPDDMEIFVAYDATEYITSSIEEVVFTLILTFALVVAVCYIFLQDWRAVLVPTLTIPVSIFATFAVLLALGYSLNTLTLFGLVLAIAHDLQVRIKREDIFSIDDVFEKYQTEKAAQFVEAKLSEDEDYAFIKKMFRNQYLMERLRDDWEPYLLEAESLLYGDAVCSGSEEQCTKYKEQYTKNKREFHTWLNTYMPDYEIQYEQLLVYFISTYFCGAVYDGEGYVKVQMAVVSVLLIHELLLAQWLKNEKTLEMEDVIDTVYRYSRELEHSDPNLNLMEKLMRRDLLSWFKKENDGDKEMDRH